MATKKSAADKPRTAAMRPTVSEKLKKTAPKKVAKKTFAEKVRDGDPGTEVWLRAGDGVARGEIRGRGGPLNGAIEGLRESDIFETEAEARAAR
jgi:hypothetical protein